MGKNEIRTQLKKDLFILDGDSCIITGRNDNLEVHHIIKQEDGGEDNVLDTILLDGDFHDFLHKLEQKNHSLYVRVNSAFIMYRQLTFIKIDSALKRELLSDFELVRIKLLELFEKSVSYKRNRRYIKIEL